MYIYCGSCLSKGRFYWLTSKISVQEFNRIKSRETEHLFILTSSVCLSFSASNHNLCIRLHLFFLNKTNPSHRKKSNFILFQVQSLMAAFRRKTSPGLGYGRCWNNGPFAVVSTPVLASPFSTNPDDQVPLQSKII